jgi:hypothetical protein
MSGYEKRGQIFDRSHALRGNAARDAPRPLRRVQGGTSIGRSRYLITEPDQPHFLTCTVTEWLPLFTRPALVDILLDCWRYQRANQGLRLYGYVVLENPPEKKGGEKSGQIYFSVPNRTHFRLAFLGPTDRFRLARRVTSLVWPRESNQREARPKRKGDRFVFCPTRPHLPVTFLAPTDRFRFARRVTFSCLAKRK